MDKHEIISNMDSQKKNDLLNALKNTENSEEAKRILAEAGIDITDEDIRNCLQKKESEQTELSDEELSDIVGGQMYSLKKSQSAEDVIFIAVPGMTVEVENFVLGIFNATVRCLVVDRKAEYMSKSTTVQVGRSVDSVTEYFYADQYFVRPLEEHWYFSEGWVTRDRIQMP